MSDLLARIDEITGLCPCGAKPRDDSAYCSYDCEPTHIIETIHHADGSIDIEGTDRRQVGQLATPMRWRPDLVTHADDSDLERIEPPLGVPQNWGYIGPHNATMWRRLDCPEWHMRLDDGHRFVGCDININGGNEELAQRIADTWAKLERELTNTRHVDPEPDPWADFLRTSREQVTVADAAPPVAGFVWRRHCPHCGNHTIPVDGRRPARIEVAWFTNDVHPIEPMPIEDCHLCRTCRRPLPGPRLAFRSELHRTPLGTNVQFTLSSGSRHIAGSLPSTATDQQIQSYLDAMERELVRNLAAERACQSGFTPDLRSLFRAMNSIT